MDKYYIANRSMTESQRMQRLLKRAGIKSAVVKLPSGVSDGGCGYAVRMEQRLDDAIAAIKRAGMKLNKIYVTSGNGSFKEVIR